MAAPRRAIDLAVNVDMSLGQPERLKQAEQQTFEQGAARLFFGERA